MSTIETPLTGGRAERRTRRGGMSILEALRVAFQGLGGNKFRAFLTMLGVIIGVASVIAMLGIGQGAAKASQEMIRKLGTNTLSVYPNSRSVGASNVRLSAAQKLTLEDAYAIRDEIPGVKAVAPECRSRGIRAKYKSISTSTSLYASTPEYFEIRNLPIGEGRIFSDEEVKRRERVCVIGISVREELFGNLNAIDKQIRIGGHSFLVVGVTQKRGGQMWRNPDDQITIPVSTFMRRVNRQDYINGISVQAENEEVMKGMEILIEDFIADRHRIPLNQPSDVRVYNQADLIESAKEQSGVMTMLMSGIALVSLLVGGIGIMNIMLVSVTERTKEIGVRKAMGAKRRDILTQFLIESMTLSLVGGIIGVGVGVGGGKLLQMTMGWPFEVSMQPIILAFVFSAAVGIFFGIYPAIKAARLHPIEALRYE